MSILGRLSHENLIDVLDEYYKGIEGTNDKGEVEAEERLRIKGKRLEVAATEHASWQYYYGVRRVELYSLMKYFEGKTAAARGKLFRKYTEQYSRELSDRQKDKYIDNDEEYLKQYEIYLEIKALHDRYEELCKAFQSRGYSINNITKIRVAAQEDVVI